MINKTYKAQIVKVVDGDTIDVSVNLDFNISVKIRVRLAGINTPEMKDKDEEQRKLAQQAKEFVDQYLYKTVAIVIKSIDIYGRYICEVDNLSQLLLEKGLAQPLHMSS